MSTLQELIARVEACGVAGNFQLECDIAIALGISKVEKHGAMNLQTTPPPYTTSLDAAVRLVEEKLPGWSVLLAFNGMRAVCDVHTKPLGDATGRWPGHAQGPTPALALVAALLRALASERSQ